MQVRALDATTVKEPGKTGSLWFVHYSVRLPSLACEFSRLTETFEVGTGGWSWNRRQGQPFDLLATVRTLRCASRIGSWEVRLLDAVDVAATLLASMLICTFSTSQNCTLFISG